MIRQLTVFLENEPGRLGALCDVLGEAGVNMHALTIAETADYGLVRIISNDVDAAKAALDKADFRSTVTKVSAIKIPDEPGALSRLLSVLEDLGLNVEYGYCFKSHNGVAADIFKIRGDAATAEATFRLEAAGFSVLSEADL